MRIWKQAHVANPKVPAPEGHGWVIIDRQMEPHWFESDVLPQQLPDIAGDQTMEKNKSDDELKPAESYSDIEIKSTVMKIKFECSLQSGHSAFLRYTFNNCPYQ